MQKASFDRKMKKTIEAYVRKKKPYDDKPADALDPLNDGCGLDVDNE